MPFRSFGKRQTQNLHNMMKLGMVLDIIMKPGGFLR